MFLEINFKNQFLKYKLVSVALRYGIMAFSKDSNLINQIM